MTKAVCIAGMHRSGTSLVAHSLHVCGLYLGSDSDLLTPAPDNPEGFWEHVGFLGVNDEVLRLLGGAWDAPPPMSDGWLRKPVMEPVRGSARALVGRFNGHDAWGWKDPRNSLTLPFWHDLLPGLKTVVCLRNPLEVASSLAGRHHTSCAFGLSLWKTYYERLLESVAPNERIVTHYLSYFADAGAEIRRVCAFLGIEPMDEAVLRCRQLVNSGLRHSGYDLFHLRQVGVPAGLIRLYARLCDEAGHREPEGGTGQLSSETVEYLRRFVPAEVL